MVRELKNSEALEGEAAKVNGAAAENVEGAMPADDNALKCGGALRAAREQQKLTTQAVAKQLRLGNKQVEALENDDFASLPEPTIVKGFIRNYSKLLKIPAEPVLAGYAALMPQSDQYAFSVGSGINMKITESNKSGSSHYLILTALLLLGLGAWFFYQHYIQRPDPVNTTPEVAAELTQELALQAPAPAVVEASAPSAAVLPAIEGQAAAVDVPSTEGVQANNDAANTEEAAVTEPEVAEETVVIYETAVSGDAVEKENTTVVDDAALLDEAEDTEPAAGKTRLVFNATQETWLSVVNASGKEVYNNILYAGNKDTIDVWQPSKITVGNAHGATLTVDGKSIDLAPYTRVNVARVRLD